MKIIRFFEVFFKLTVCIPFRRKWILVRVVLLPFHLVFTPNLVLMSYTKRVKYSLESLGVVFIKLGQSLSLKSFLFEKPLLRTLSHLQDAVTTSGGVNIKKHLERNSILQNKQFAVEENPISVASVAHVYKGSVYVNGNHQDVAIKVVKKGIYEQIQKDFSILFPFVKVINFFCSPALQLVDVARDIYEGLLREINLKNEIQNLMDIKRNLILDSAVKIPKVFPEYSNNSTLVMEFIDGVSIRKLIYGEYSGVNRKAVAKAIVETYLNQVYRDGIFHADMHSGNIMALHNSEIALLDFGIISTITKQDRRAVATIIYAFLHNNYELVIQTQLEAGYISDKIYYNEQYRFAMKDLAKVFSQGFDMSLFTRDLFKIMNSFNVFVPKHLLLLNKTIMYIEDVTKQLDSQFDPFSIMIPWLKKWYYKERILIFLEKL